MATIKGEGRIINADMTMKATATVRRNHAVQNLKAAATFAQKAGALELEHKDKEYSDFFDEIRSYVNGAVLMSAAAFEAYFNEIMVNRNEDEDFIKAMDKFGTINRYNFYLKFQKIKPIPLGEPIAQNAKALISLRNALVHPRPSTVGEKGMHSKIINELKDRFKPTTFLSDREELFPMTYVSQDCAKWSIESVLALSKEFSTRLEVDCLFDKHPHFYEADFISKP